MFVTQSCQDNECHQNEIDVQVDYNLYQHNKLTFPVIMSRFHEKKADYHASDAAGKNLATQYLSLEEAGNVVDKFPPLLAALS